MKSYLESVAAKDIHERKDRKRDPEKMKTLLRSLARNESTTAGDSTLVRDIEEWENEGELAFSRQTAADYLSVLDSLYLTCNQEAFALSYRSSQRVGKSAKRHLVDPSLACAALNLNTDKLLGDLETFGFLFEALAERDLRIYAETLEGHLYHFRDNASGNEVDAILEFPDGEYAACEIKLSGNGVDSAKKSLMKFYDNVKKKPCFMCVIFGHFDAAIRDPETGIYLFPLTALKP